jgi:glycosyltransferase involved in cell wall biosynthesis
MKILLNALPLTEIVTGVQRYVRCLYAEMQSLPDVSVLYCTRFGAGSQMPLAASAGTWSKRIGMIHRFPTPVIVGSRILARMLFERHLRQLNREAPYDVCHEPAFFSPVLNGIPIVTTVHDLSVIKHPEKHPRDRVLYFNLLFRRRLERADHILTVSDFTRQEVMEELGIAPHKVTTVHLAHEATFHPRPQSEIRSTLGHHGWPGEYILFVGTLEPRKNLQLLVKALPMLRSDVPLLLTGWSGWGDKDWWDEIRRMGLEKRIILTGYVDEPELACLYSGASAFVYPSFYEGFGLPVLEAMASGCPVICSDRASLPEVAGNAAILVDPHDAGALAHSIEKVLHDSDLRNRMATAGLERAGLFSWKKTALETLDVFKKVSKRTAS